MLTTLYDEFITIFGEYTPTLGTDPVSGATIDCINFGYIFSCLFACVALYCILRIVGSLIKSVCD